MIDLVSVDLTSAPIGLRFTRPLRRTTAERFAAVVARIQSGEPMEAYERVPHQIPHVDRVGLRNPTPTCGCPCRCTEPLGRYAWQVKDGELAPGNTGRRTKVDIDVCESCAGASACEARRQKRLKMCRTWRVWCAQESEKRKVAS